MDIITMNDFLTNPTGKSSSSFARRDLIIADLEVRYDKLIKIKPIKIDMYRDKDTYIFYFRIPSEKFTKKLFYDVVLEFIPPSSNSSTIKTINNYRMKMFSNSPNFMFTYAYVYNKDNNLVTFLKSKISSKALKEPPKVKNPQMSYGFEKSVYFALLYLKRNKLYLKSSLLSVNKIPNRPLIKNKIKSSKDKLDEYNKIKMIEDKKAKKIKNDNKRTIANNRTTHRNHNKSVKKPKSNLKVKRPIKSTVKKK